MNKSIKSTVAMAALAVLGMSAAQATEGFYAGAAGMQSRFDSDNFDADDVDDEDTGWRIIGGYRASPNFAIEGSFTQFGEAQAPAVGLGGSFEAKAQAFSVFGVGLVPLGPVELFAKVGAARIDAEGNVGAVFFDDKKIELAYGAGAQLVLGRVALRASYEKFDTDVIGDLDVISAGITFSFGAE